jgi:hypothetical protein
MATYDISGTKLFIAIPVYDGKLPIELVHGLLATYGWFQKSNAEVIIQFEKNNALIAYARNSLIHEFLQTDATHLLFIDGDIHFKCDDVLRLLALGTKHPIVGATYPVKKDETKYHIHLSPGKNHPGATDDGFLEVSGLGLGFCMFQRRVFEETAQYCALYNDHSTGTRREVREYCQQRIMHGELVGEDIFLLREVCEKHGFQPVLDWTIDLGHIGTKEYRGDLVQALLKAGWLETNQQEATEAKTM